MDIAQRAAIRTETWRDILMDEMTPEAAAEAMMDMAKKLVPRIEACALGLEVESRRVWRQKQ